MESNSYFRFSILDYAHRYSVMYIENYLLTTSEVWLTLLHTEKYKHGYSNLQIANSLHLFSSTEENCLLFLSHHILLVANYM